MISSGATVRYQTIILVLNIAAVEYIQNANILVVMSAHRYKSKYEIPSGGGVYQTSVIFVLYIVVDRIYYLINVKHF